MNIWTQNGNRIAVLAPGPGDLFVVTTIRGVRAALHPIAEYERAIAIANALAQQTTDPVKVLCMSFLEMLAFVRISPRAFWASLSPETKLEFQQLTIRSCFAALRECNDAKVRDEAYRLLVELRAIAPEGAA